MAKLGTRKRVSKSRVVVHAGQLRVRNPRNLSEWVPQPKLGTIYIAVIVRAQAYSNEFFSDFFLTSHRTDGGWYALMSMDKDKLIAEALVKRTEFGGDRYEVWVGTLTEKVLIPTNFEVVKL